MSGRPWFGPLLLAVVATIVVLLALDPAGDYPDRFEGPGLTIDEIFNVDLGARLADRVLSGDIPGAVKLGQTLPDHPPLGRLWLGLFHEFVLLIDPPRGEHSALVVAAARTGSAVAFGILIWLVGWSAAKWYGHAAGWGAAASLILIPRVFGHAHLAALESVLNLTYVAAIISVARLWSKATPPNCRTALLCGIWFGLALLTKIQAVFIPIPIAVWAFVNWRQKALLPLLLWGLTGLGIFWCGWPWLWLDPIGHFLKYLGHASDRASIQVWYWGQAWADKDVPWHYPWVMFAVTVPISLHVLGISGVVERLSRVVRNTAYDSGESSYGVDWLLLASLLFPLIMFSVPGVAVYDGERLFLIVFPLWAIFIGRGVTLVIQWLNHRIPQGTAVAVTTLFLCVQSIGLWQLAPCWLSYYNLPHGLVTAQNTGFQLTYWGDSVTRELWTEVAAKLPQGATLEVAPVLHPFQLTAWESQSPALRKREIKLKPLNLSQGVAPATYILIFQRTEYLPSGWSNGSPGYRPIKEMIRQGVILAGLYRNHQDSPR